MKIPCIFMPKKDSNKNIEVLLNTKNIGGLIEDYKEFCGSVVEQMPLLVAEGRVPLSVLGLMRKRLESLDSYDQEIVDYWWNNYFNTGDAVIYHPNGRLKVVLNAEPIWKEINQKSKLKNGSLILPKGMYAKLKGDIFTREEIKKHDIAKKRLTKEETKRNPLWKALAGGDKSLLDAYVNAAFKKAKEEYSYNKLMRIWLPPPQEITIGHLWCVYSLYGSSNADGNINLDDNYGRLVGVVPEVH